MKLRPALLLVLGVGHGLAGALVLWNSFTAARTGDYVVLGLGLDLVALVLLALGIAGLASARRPSEPASYRHAYRIFASVGVVLVAAGAARAFAIPDTFGAFGHFRGEAPADARSRAKRHLGREACAKCHPKQAGLHGKDAHARVQCEVCHGAGAEHAASPKAVRLVRPSGKKPCLVCHQRLEARPAAFAQIEPAVHYRAAGVKDLDLACTKCHDPHEPLFLDRAIASARLHPRVHRCRDCHTGPTRDPKMPRPATHPAIFECKYCHPKTAFDFASKPHHNLECSACHLFYGESEFAGRIVRDADPRFCLLCHGAAPLRGPGAPPSISWPAHREEMGQGPEDAAKRCIDCHRDRIHELARTDSPVAPEGKAGGKPDGT
jgi:hypothetical protein